MKITLISWPNNPLKAIHCAVENMNGNMIHDMDNISVEEAVRTLEELKKTRLNGAIEFGGDYIFQIEDVPRAFTHQAVRNRVGASYSQESMRFAKKEGKKFDYDIGPSIEGDVLKEKVYNNIMDNIHQQYETLLKKGATQQDARGVLPINTLTKIGVRFNLMTLIKITEVRLCYQSQGHWRAVVEEMKKQIAEKVSPEIASLMMKACDRTGKCEFKSVFDRDCPVEKKLINDICEDCEQRWGCEKYKKGTGMYCKPIKKFMMREG
jgi:thymidylate synthase (FAD)